MEFKERPIIVTDLETSGIDPREHDIIEIGAFKVNQDLEVLDQFERQVVMQYPVKAQPKALEVNGYLDRLDDWKTAVTITEAMMDYAAFSFEGVLAAWNITFEYSFLTEAFRKTGVTHSMDYHRIDVPSICWSNIRQFKRLGQDPIAEALGLPPEPQPHKAMTGAQYALDILRQVKHSLIFN